MGIHESVKCASRLSVLRRRGVGEYDRPGGAPAQETMFRVLLSWLHHCVRAVPNEEANPVPVNQKKAADSLIKLHHVNDRFCARLPVTGVFGSGSLKAARQPWDEEHGERDGESMRRNKA